MSSPSQEVKLEAVIAEEEDPENGLVLKFMLANESSEEKVGNTNVVEMEVVENFNEESHPRKSQLFMSKCVESSSCQFQCACCAQNYYDPFMWRQFADTTVLEVLSTLLEFPTIVTKNRALIFECSLAEDWQLCLDCGQHLSDLYKMFERFRNMLQKEGQIWKAIVGGRDLRSRNKKSHVKNSCSVAKRTSERLGGNNFRKGGRKKAGGDNSRNKKRCNSKVKSGRLEDKVIFTSIPEEEPCDEMDEFNLSLREGASSFEPDLQGLGKSQEKPFRTKSKTSKRRIRKNKMNTDDVKDTDLLFTEAAANSPSTKRIRNWKKESWLEKAKSDPSRTCDLCGKSFIFPAVMKRHKKIVHQGLKPYECTSCGKRFTQKVILNKHTCDFSKETGNRDLLQMNREDQLRKFICSVCGKRFKYPTHLSLHEMNHREERPYPCQQCEKTFRRPDHLKYHVRIVHVDEKKFICTKCGQTFKSISSLRAHEKKHTSDQGHMCNICGKSIKSMYQMSRHKKTHQDELPFECPVCGKRFKMKDYLGQHLRRGKTCSKKLPSFKEGGNNSVVNNLTPDIVEQTLPVTDNDIRRDSAPNNSGCSRNFGPITSDIVTLEFSSCFPVDDRLLTEL